MGSLFSVRQLQSISNWYVQIEMTFESKVVYILICIYLQLLIADPATVSAVKRRKAVLQWISQLGDRYNIIINNITSCFQDGKAFIALAAALDPQFSFEDNVSFSV